MQNLQRVRLLRPVKCTRHTVESTYNWVLAV